MLKNKGMLVVLASLVLGLSACGGGGSDSSSSSSSGSSTGGSSSGSATQTGLSSVDFSKQVFIKSADGNNDDSTALLFHADGNGINYDGNGEGAFAWSITNDKMDIGTDNGENINFALKSKVDNNYTFTITEPSGTFENEWHKALPLSLAILDGKILAFDVSDDPNCSARTIKITGASVSLKDICTDGNSDLTMTLSTVSDVDNALQFNFNDENGAREITMVLVEGSVAQTGTIAFIHKINDVFTEVEIETITATDTEASVAIEETSSGFQVVNKKLIMTSETSDSGENNKVLFGFNSTADNPVYIQSLEADLSLIDSSISGDARARIGFFQRLKSTSDDVTVGEIFVAIDDRASGLVSTAILTVNGVDTNIANLHRISLDKGTNYNFKIDSTEESDNIVINFAGATGTIAKSVFPSNDIYVQHASIATRVKNAEAGNFAKASIDNLVLTREKGGMSKMITLNFDDGVTPVADDEFNQVEF